MKHYFKPLLFLQLVLLVSSLCAVNFNDSWSVAMQSMHRADVTYTSNGASNKHFRPKSFDLDFKQFLSSSVCGTSCKLMPPPIRPNCSWTLHDFARHFEQLLQHDTTLVVTHRDNGLPRYELTTAGQQKILEQLPLYAYQGFREYVATFQAYPQFIKNLCAQLDNNDFSRMINKQLVRSHEFRTSNQWQERIPVLEFYKLQRALPPEGYSQQRVTACQSEAQQTAANKQTFIENAQQVLQDPLASAQHKEFAQKVQQAATIADGSCTTALHEATPELLAAAKQHQITVQDVQVTFGSKTKHVVQDGLTKTGNEAATAPKNNLLAPDITDTALIGIQYNQAGFVDKALIIANFCHVALDYTRKFGSFTYGCAQGIGLGVIDGLNNVSAMIQDPRKAALEMVTGLGHLGGYLFKVIYHVGTIKSEMDGDFFGSCDQLEQFSVQTAAVTQAIGQKLASIPTRELVRQIVSASVEGWLSSKLLMTIGSFCAKTAKLCTVAAHEIKRTVQTAKIAQPIAAGLPAIEGLASTKTGMLFNEIEGQIKNVNRIIAPKAVISLEEIATKYSAACERLGLKLPSKKFIKHINNGHMPGGQNAILGSKSVFNHGENFIELALNAWEFGSEIKQGIKLFDCGRIIGVTKEGMPTSKVLIALNRTLDGFASIYPI